MEKTCLKCNPTAELEDYPDAECSRCGAIYSRVSNAVSMSSSRARSESPQMCHQQRAAATRSSPYPSPLWLRAITIFVAFLTLLPATILVTTGALKGTLGVIVWVANLTIFSVLYMMAEATRAVFATANAAEDAQHTFRLLLRIAEKTSQKVA